MANISIIFELCRTSEKLQEAFQQINHAREETAQIRQCLQDVSVQASELGRALAASEARVQELQAERDMLSLLVTSFQYTIKPGHTDNDDTSSTTDLYEP